MNRMNVICLGVKNMERALKFYRDGLGFKTNEKGDNPQVVFFNTYGTKLELYPLQALAEDINAENPPAYGNGFSGITLAYNVPSKEDVDKTIEYVKKAGGKIAKEPVETFWGGYHGYFQDTEGYYWEVAYGPQFQFDENEMLIL